ncbi:MAG: 1-deoxy-D-xylulose-5-phosphate reductoisomerase [Ruminococcaceae bacterium]|nr:1-deoxy-D-xylulose-5-phosphate reductoisomerase [Oscillospiraceae bacterium]
MTKNVSILGSTGSIGRQTINVCRRNGIKVKAITANSNTELVYKQALEFKPELVAVFDEDAAAILQNKLKGENIRVLSGMQGLIEAATLQSTDCVVTAVSGSVGLMPTLAAIDAKKRIALANKETLVCAGELVMKRAREKKAEILPVDSEHSAIFQCMHGRENELSRILLTASGGPFLGKSLSETENVTPEMAVSHPNWSMGAKISVDSATMMNKGLELIEAMHLFSCNCEDIEIIIHPQSIIHSMVELKDGTVIAQLAAPDMEIPIQYALTYPERASICNEKLDFSKLSDLQFMLPDLEKLPCLRLAIECAKKGGTAPAIMSAANEMAVALFLNRKIKFNEIYKAVSEALSHIPATNADTLEKILEADSRARDFIRENYN